MDPERSDPALTNNHEAQPAFDRPAAALHLIVTSAESALRATRDARVREGVAERTLMLLAKYHRGLTRDGVGKDARPDLYERLDRAVDRFRRVRNGGDGD